MFEFVYVCVFLWVVGGQRDRDEALDSHLYPRVYTFVYTECRHTGIHITSGTRCTVRNGHCYCEKGTSSHVCVCMYALAFSPLPLRGC